MALLPALAERCALERVLADAGTVLAVLGEILRAFAAGGGGAAPPPLPGGGGGDFTDLGFPAESTDGGAPDPERAAPLASLSAALLVGVLELGAEHRPAEEERLLDGLREPLEAIARGGESAELAEMAGHALALVAARGAGELGGEPAPPPPPPVGQGTTDQNATAHCSVSMLKTVQVMRRAHLIDGAVPS
jgi:hypothetical protein